MRGYNSNLRYVYASVALAQWYKTLDRSQILFGNIIDSNDIYTYDLNISFDKAYWEQQSNQRITDNISFNTCFKQGWTSCYSWIRGGVVYVNLNINITSVLSNESNQIVSNAINTVYSQKSDENNSFFYGNLTIENVTFSFLIDFTKYYNIEFGVNLSIFEDYSDSLENITNGSLVLNDSNVIIDYQDSSFYENNTEQINIIEEINGNGKVVDDEN